MKTQNNMFTNQMIVSFIGTNDCNRCDKVGYFENIRNEGFNVGKNYTGLSDVTNSYSENSAEYIQFELGFIEGFEFGQ